jgi:hypothetical protein
MKSHDHHVMIQQILPTCVRNILLIGVCQAIIRLSKCFQKICMKVVNPNGIPFSKVHVVETLSMLEMLFPPGIFDIMIHLLIHLVEDLDVCTRRKRSICDHHIYNYLQLFGLCN